MAVAVCEVSLKKVTDAGQLERDEGVEAVALHVWARSIESHPELKSLAVELNELSRQHDDRQTGDGLVWVTEIERAVFIRKTVGSDSV